MEHVDQLFDVLHVQAPVAVETVEILFISLGEFGNQL